MEYLILFSFGVFTGITASLFGFGGGFIIVPLIYHLIGNNPYSMQIAVATSISIMIVNSINAMLKHHKAGNIIWERVVPLAYYIAIGSVVGSILATQLNSSIVRYLFITYMVFVIYDCTMKKNFVNQANEQKHLTSITQIWAGTVIGIIASALGVGGSVLTVPLMRKLGLSMKYAVALANPMSLPVAIIGTIVYIIIGIHTNIHLGSKYIGFIYIPGLIILSASGFIGVPIGTYLADKVPDKIHARIYILLLLLTLISMLIK